MKRVKWGGLPASLCARIGPVRKNPYDSIQKFVIPAKAGTHLSAAAPVEKWVPAFAGMTKFL
jgi:hypothetical protein